MNLNALLARTEVWPASEQYEARYMLHLVLPNGEFLSLSTTPDILAQAEKLGTMKPVALVISIERTYKDGRVRLAADAISVATKADVA